MKSWKNKIVPILFAIGGAGWLVKTLKQIINEEPVTMAPLVFAGMAFTFAIVFGVAAGRKSEGGSSAPSA